MIVNERVNLCRWEARGSRRKILLQRVGVERSPHSKLKGWQEDDCYVVKRNWIENGSMPHVTDPVDWTKCKILLVTRHWELSLVSPSGWHTKKLERYREVKLNVLFQKFDIILLIIYKNRNWTQLQSVGVVIKAWGFPTKSLRSSNRQQKRD